MLILIIFTACTPSTEVIIVEDANRYIMLESPYYYDTKTDEIRSIETLPTEELYLYFIQGNLAFYSEIGNYAGVNLSVLNLNTYERKNIYRDGILYDKEGLLGLDMLFPSLGTSSYNSSMLRFDENSWFCDNKIYTFWRQKLQCLDLNSGAIEYVYEELNISEILREESNVYIICDDNKLYLSDEACTELELLSENFVCENFVFDGETVYYITAENPNVIYKLESDEPFYIDISNLMLCYAGSDVIIVYAEDTGTYYAVYNEGNIICIDDFLCYEIVYVDEEKIYFYTGETVFYLYYNDKTIKENRDK